MAQEQLWRDGRPVRLRPKSFAVLCHLVSHAQQLVKKEDLIKNVWAEVAVGDAVLNTSLKEIRKALGDSARRPRFIETAHGRGYRFIAKLASDTPRLEAAHAVGPQADDGARRPTLIGRDTQLARLERGLDAARSGRCQTWFVAGELGVGKQTLVDEFLTRNASRSDVLIGRARCVLQQSHAEPYLPILEALSRPCRGSVSALHRALRHPAPGSLARFPWQTGPEAQSQDSRAPTLPRMLGELTDAIDEVTRQHPLLLCLEELHHADGATLDLVEYLSQRPNGCALMLLCTYRPLEGQSTSHRRIRSIEYRLDHGSLGGSVVLPYWTAPELACYIQQRFDEPEFGAELAALIYSRTHGKPSFSVMLCETWIDRGWLVRRAGAWCLNTELRPLANDLPESIVAAVELEIDSLPPLQRRVLEAGSVAGIEFSASSVSRALGHDLAEVEETCLDLVRARRLLRLVKEDEPFVAWRLPHFAFLSPMQREAIRSRVGLVRRTRLLQQFFDCGA